MSFEDEWGSSSDYRRWDDESPPPPRRPAGPWASIGLGMLLVVIAAVGYLLLKSDGDHGAQEGDGDVVESVSPSSQPAEAASSGVPTSVAPVAGGETPAPSATVVSSDDAMVTTIGGDPSDEGAWRYVVQPGDYPVAVADRFTLKSWRDIFALNGWVTLEEFPLAGTEILLPPSTVGTSGQPCDESTVLQELSASDADFERVRDLMQSGEIWIASFECGAGRGRGIDSNYASFGFTSDTPYMCMQVTADGFGDSYPCGAPGPDDGYDCDRAPAEQQLDQEIVCYQPDGLEASAERVNGRWEYLGSGSAGLWCDDFRGREAREELCG